MSKTKRMTVQVDGWKPIEGEFLSVERAAVPGVDENGIITFEPSYHLTFSMIADEDCPWLRRAE